MSVNTCFFGVNITLKQRDVLDSEAKRRGITRNALIRTLINNLEKELYEQTIV